MEIAEINFEVDFNAVFLLGIVDEDARVRAISVKSLWEYEHPSLIKPLVHLLKTDEAPAVREAAASTLGKFVYLRELEEIDPNEASLAEEALLETIYQASEDLHVRRRALEAVSFSADPRIAPIIESAYYSDEDKMQVSAIFAMGRNADVAWLPRIMTELDNPNNEIRFEACRACGELEAREAVDALIQLIDEDTDVEVQEMAIWALGRIGGDTAREALEIIVDGDNEVLSQAAEESLDELNLFSDAMMLYDFSEYDGGDEIFLEDMDFTDTDFGNGRNGLETEDFLN
jgi:HEAT repeat protein